MVDAATAAGPGAVVPCTELGFYGLAGGPQDPRALLDELRDGEALGLGSVFLSERFNVKEAATLAGACAAATTRLGIATAATNHHTRHPMVTASFATTMHRLTGGRFSLGLGRGIKPLFDLYGLPATTTGELERFATVARRLWAGEAVVGEPAFGGVGATERYPVLVLDPTFREQIPLTITAFGPNTLALAGRTYDAVVLHTFFTDETTARAVDAVRRAADRASRDPASVRIWSCLATVGDHLPAEHRLRKTVGRLATYLQAYGELLVDTNRWDRAALERFRRSEAVAQVRGAIDAAASVEQLERIAEVVPEAWLAPSATGGAERCARAVAAQFDLGVDSVILHGATPAELAPVLDAYRAVRPVGRFDALAANPGWMAAPAP